MIFASDNWAGAAPEVMDAVVRANGGMTPAYGADPLSAKVEKRFCEIFERDVAVFFVGTGGASNCLALSVMSPPYGMILCHEDSHVQKDECAGPEFFTGGAKLMPLRGFAGKLAPETIEKAYAGFPVRGTNGAPPRVLSLTQANECGVVYTPAELSALCDFAHRRGLLVHMDGARFANALVSLDCSPADITWKVGVDALCLGGTKNGCFAAESVIFFDKARAADFLYRRKRAGHLWSKQRFIAAQFDAYFEDGLWLRLARHANMMARQLSEGLAAIDGVKIWYPTEANEVFASFPGEAAQKLRDKGAAFHSWVTPSDPAEGRLNRLICSFATKAEDVDTFLAAARTACR
ncbi:MAG: low specificity L-threonine aldolase [Amphiplicatus sp.]